MSRSGFKSKGRGRAGPQPRAVRPDPGAVAAQFAQALTLHQAGRLDEAEAIYRGVLDLDPSHFDARHNVGLIHYQRGEHIAALRHIDAAMHLKPNVAAAHNNRGAALAALGRLQEACESYGRAVALKPDYVDALLNRGNALKDLGCFELALESYESAIAMAPGQAAAFAKRGDVLQALRRFDEALASYDCAIRLKPDYCEAYNNRGAALAELGRLADAVASYERAIALRPDHAESLSNRGVALASLGRSEEAIESFERALAVRPDHMAALVNRGDVLHELERYDEAVESYGKAIALEPDRAGAHCNLGNALSALNRFDEALASYERALGLNPDHPEALNNRGNVLSRLQRLDEAITSYDRAVALKPDYAEAFSNLGNALRDLRRSEEALTAHDRAIALDPGHAEYHNNRAIVLAGLKRYDEAEASYARAIALKPDYVEAYSNRGWMLRDLKRPEEALGSFAQACALAPDHDYLRGTCLHARKHLCDWTHFDRECAAVLTGVNAGKAAALPFHLLGIPASPEQQLRCSQFHVADKFGTPYVPLWRGERYVHRRIRLAYLSADLRDHPIAMLTSGMFQRHDRSRFETVAISFKSDHHSRTGERLQSHFDRFIEAQSMSDREVARLVRELEIDIAVDLNGYTEGSRPHVFAQRPAPVQVNYLGYAGTLGGAHWDYIIADRFVIPETSRPHYAEQVVHLPDSFMVNDCDRRISSRTPSRAEVGLPETGFVFCCFNNNFKITPHVFDIWMRLLGAIEGSVLWLSSVNASAAEHLREEAAQRGIAPSRLIFAPRVPLNEDHLARLRLADLFVDTLYYNAHTTAADALWAGIPVLTCPGATFASRVAGSLLGAVGLTELIAGSLADYEAAALQLARDPARLSALRQRLAGNRHRFPLFDTDRFTRHVEAAYTTMWERAQRGEPPRSFAIAVEPGGAKCSPEGLGRHDA